MASRRIAAENANGFTYCNRLRIAPKTDSEVRIEYSAVVVEEKMTDARHEDQRCVQVGVIPDDY